MSNGANRLRAFADVVSIDAWHDQFSSDNKRVDLHADVVFGEGRIGGEADSQVRFRLSIKRAEVVVVVPGAEPLAVDRRSVERFALTASAKRNMTETTTIKAGADVDGKVDICNSGVSPSATLRSQASFEKEKMEQVSRSEELCSIKITYRRNNADETDNWILEPTQDSVLNGRPWDPLEKPLLKLVDKRGSVDTKIPPSARVEVFCLREDLEITDLEVKNETIWEKVKSIAGIENRKKAVEAYIRNKLEEAGLEAGSIEDEFAKIILGRVLASNGGID